MSAVMGKKLFVGFTFDELLGAISMGNESIVKEAVAENPDVVYEIDDEGYTLLMRAACEYSPDLVLYLVTKQSNIQDTDLVEDQGFNAIQHAQAGYQRKLIACGNNRKQLLALEQLKRQMTMALGPH